jgi:hypothetical protein
MKKFYHVAWKDDQGESYDMFVVAESAAEAAQHCVDYFELDTEQADDMDGDPGVSTLPMAVPDDMPLGPLSWNDIFLTTESVPKSSLKFQPGADEDEFCGRRRMTDPVAEDPRVVALVEHILAEKARDGDEAGRFLRAALEVLFGTVEPGHYQIEFLVKDDAILGLTVRGTRNEPLSELRLDRTLEGRGQGLV